MQAAPETLLHGWIILPVRAPKRTLGALLLVSLLVGSGVFKLGFDPSTEKVFPAGNLTVETYNRFRDTFGGDEGIPACAALMPTPFT